MMSKAEDAGLDGRVEAWRVRAEHIGERARLIAALDEDDPAALEVESTVLADLEEDVDALIGEGDAVLADLSARWADEDDVTSAEADPSVTGTLAVLVRPGVMSDAIGARDSAYWLFAGQAQVAADLLAAAEPPAAALEALGGGEPPRFFADAILDPRAVEEPRELPPELGDALDRLSDAAGGELVRLGVCGATIATPGMLLNGLTTVLGGTAGALLNEWAAAIGGVFAKVKRIALKLAGWVVDRVKVLLPRTVRTQVEDLLTELIGDATANAGPVVGQVAAKAMGRGGTERAWSDAQEADRDLTSMVARLAETITPHLAQIAWVSRVRGLADRVASVLTAVVAAVPQAAVAVWLVVLAGAVAVISRLWDGLRDVKHLATAPV